MSRLSLSLSGLQEADNVWERVPPPEPVDPKQEGATRNWPTWEQNWVWAYRRGDMRSGHWVKGGRASWYRKATERPKQGDELLTAAVMPEDQLRDLLSRQPPFTRSTA